MIRIIAYPARVEGYQVDWRVFRQNNRGTVVAMDPALCVALARKRGGRARVGPGRALVVDTAGLRAIRRYYVDVEGDRPTVYGAGGQEHTTVCGALRSFFGFVPDGGGC